jgi:hypothetical protein
MCPRIPFIDKFQGISPTSAYEAVSEPSARNERVARQGLLKVCVAVAE